METKIHPTHAANAQAWSARTERRTQAIHDAGEGLEIARDVLRNVAKELDREEVGDQGMTQHMLRLLLVELDDVRSSLVSCEVDRLAREKRDWAEEKAS